MVFFSIRISYTVAALLWYLCMDRRRCGEYFVLMWPGSCYWNSLTNYSGHGGREGQSRMSRWDFTAVCLVKLVSQKGLKMTWSKLRIWVSFIKQSRSPVSELGTDSSQEGIPGSSFKECGSAQRPDPGQDKMSSKVLSHCVPPWWQLTEKKSRAF